MILKLRLPLLQLFFETVLNVLLGRFGGHIWRLIGGGGSRRRGKRASQTITPLSIRAQQVNNNRCLSITSATSVLAPGMLVRLTRWAILRRARNYATAASNDPAKIRNIALVAHIGMASFWLFRLPKSDKGCV